MGSVGATGHGDEGDDTRETAECHLIASREIEGVEESVGAFVPLKSSKENIAPSSIQRMFQQDFPEFPKTFTKKTYLAMSLEDRKFMNITSRGIHKANNGYYEVLSPLRDENVNLPCNRELAETRLKQLSRRFASNPRYKEDYVAFLEKMLEDEHAAKAPNQCETAWYIPHHGVYHPKKAGKLRVVLDCSVEFQGHSLNRNLLQGLDLTNSLVGVLCRFRQEPVAFACDIEGMFHQVHVNDEHCHFLRFLWWDQEDTTKKPEEYRLTVHLCGANLSS